MRYPALPEVEQLVEEISDEVADAAPSADALWNITGPPTGGKTTALKLLAARLAERGLVPIFVGPPARVLDSGPLAMTEALVGLKSQNVVNGELDMLCEERAWSEKVEKLRGAMAAIRDRLVVLSDEPSTWSSRSPDDAHFRDHADELAWFMVGGLACRRIVAGTLPVAIRSAPHRIRHLRAKSPASAWLRSSGVWGPLGPEAAELASLMGTELEPRSPLELRLLVALATLERPGEVAQWLRANAPGRRDISRRLAAALQSRSDSTREFLKTSWSQLALVRRPIARDLLDEVAGVAPDERAGALLERCLLYPDDEGFTLHWMLRLDVQEQLRPALGSTVRTHGVLARFYTRRFEQRREANTPGTLLDEMEAFHHAAQSGDSELYAQLRPLFAEQLDALGRTLSRDFKKYDEAAQVFERACQWEPDDDYAHHYRAFNLDIIADAPPAIEHHYQRAIELRADHLWWHSRWVNYLITRGRIPAARRAWTHALDVLGLPDPEAETSAYEGLHLWVARLLVHRGRLDFAEEVLGGIPPEALQAHPGLSAIVRRLKALAAARANRALFPLSVAYEAWWDGPHLCPRRREAGALVRWMPGRIDEIDAHAIELAVAQPPPAPSAEPVYGSIRLPQVDFDRWTGDERSSELSAGRFVELAWYGEREEPLIRVHRGREWMDRELPPLFPDPARYLRKAGWVKSG